MKELVENNKKSLRGADLREAKLSGAKLSEANLSEAKLREADLSWADLSGTDLSGANLNRANLSGADLSGANLSGADLSKANLREADLSKADLSGTNLRGADLREADGCLRASCSWTDHGEGGCELLAVVIDNEPVYFCGCFMGSEGELREYIAEGEEKYKASRTIAFNFVSQRIKEMMEEREEGKRLEQ